MRISFKPTCSLHWPSSVASSWATPHAALPDCQKSSWKRIRAFSCPLALLPLCHRVAALANRALQWQEQAALRLARATDWSQNLWKSEGDHLHAPQLYLHWASTLSVPQKLFSTYHAQYS